MERKLRIAVNLVQLTLTDDVDGVSPKTANSDPETWVDCARRRFRDQLYRKTRPTETGTRSVLPQNFRRDLDAARRQTRTPRRRPVAATETDACGVTGRCRAGDVTGHAGASGDVNATSRVVMCGASGRRYLYGRALTSRAARGGRRDAARFRIFARGYVTLRNVGTHGVVRQCGRVAGIDDDVR